MSESTHTSERRGVAEERCHSRDRLAIILEGVADGITAQDPTGRLIYANEAAARMAGYSSPEGMLAAPPGEVVQQYEIMDEAGQPLPLEQLPGRLAFQGQTSPETTVCFRSRATREVRWSVVRTTPIFDESGRIQFAVNIFRDITRERQALARLREQEEQYRSIFECTSDGLTIRDLSGGIVEANPAMCEMHGYSRAEFLALSSTAIIHPDDHLQFAGCVRSVAEGSEFRGDGLTYARTARSSPSMSTSLASRIMGGRTFWTSCVMSRSRWRRTSFWSSACRSVRGSWPCCLRCRTTLPPPLSSSRCSVSSSTNFGPSSTTILPPL